MTTSPQGEEPARASLQDLDNAPPSLPTTRPEDVGGALETLRARFVDVAAENDALRQENDTLKRGASTILELDKLIGPSAKAAFRYMSLYSAGSFILLLLDGSHVSDFDLPDSVLNLLVGSTAVTVLGLVGMVLTGIFVGARKAGVHGAGTRDQ